MNNRGMVRWVIIVLLLVSVVLLYFYTDPTKELVGMLVNVWDPVDIDDENKSVTIQFADASKIAHKVVLGEVNESVDSNSTALDDEPEESESKYADLVEL